MAPPTESPFREEDQQARVDALRGERDELSARLNAVRRELSRRQWGRARAFLLGSAVFPAMIAVVIAVLALSC